MKKYSFKEKLSYRFDNLMSKGTVALVGVLFAMTAIIVIIAAIFLGITGQETTFGGNVWASAMHVIDAGTITGAETTDIWFIVIMCINTLCGLFITSILIGIITTGFEEKLNQLKKGNSSVIEKNHTVILGFDNNIYTLISELVIANENQKSGCIVILSEDDKEDVENAIAENLQDLKNTRIICRTGSITDTNMLEKCALETCRSIIINEKEDFITIKAILAINAYLKEHCGEDMPYIVATMQSPSNYEAAQIVAEGNAEIVLVQDSISRIIAQTCRQPGLSNVLIELFDYDGDELYFEDFPELAGKTFGESLNYFEKAIVFGYRRDGKVYLNPAPETVLEQDDSLLVLEDDDGVAKPIIKDHLEGKEVEFDEDLCNVPATILILGINEMVERIVLELDNYYVPGSTIIVADEMPLENAEEIQAQLSNITIQVVCCDINNRENLENLTASKPENVLILSNEECDRETADSMTLLKLIHLRDISKQLGRNYSITSEMKDTANQKLAKVAQVNDLVVGSNIINLMLTQVSENRQLAVVFQELLTAEGSEIYIRDAAHYVQLGVEVDFYQVTNILKERNQIAVGYKKQDGDQFEIITNPAKSEKIVFESGDCIIALAED